MTEDWAIQRVDAVLAKGKRWIRIACGPDGIWDVAFADGETEICYARDPDRRRAIVLACLKAMGVECQ